MAGSINSLNNVKIIEDMMRYVGEFMFEVHDTGGKIVITLRDGSTHWFLYSSRTTAKDMYGEVIDWLMNRET